MSGREVSMLFLLIRGLMHSSCLFAQFVSSSFMC